MKLFRTTILLFLYLQALASCVSKKELTYFRDADAKQEYTTVPKDIFLRPGDVLSITISTLPTSQFNTYSNSDLQNNSVPIINGYTISEQNTIQLPVIGEVHVAGKTVDQARSEITKLVGEYFQNASVKVHLLSFTISVLGEVARPGQYTIYKNRTSLLDGLALGGDLLPSADRNRVYIIRTDQGITTRYQIDLQQDSLFSAKYFYLQPDDVIYAEPARYRSVNPLQPWSIVISGVSLIAVLLNVFIQ